MAGKCKPGAEVPLVYLLREVTGKQLKGNLYQKVMVK